MTGRPITGEGAARQRPRTLGAVARIAGVAVVVMIAGACGSDGEPDTFRAGPAFHSAGPEARTELQAVLESQAELIVAGDWTRYYELYVPTERARCSAVAFGIFAEQQWSQLRQEVQGMTLSARVADVKVNGFRATVQYQLVVTESALATQLSTNSYLKLGDRWFIQEEAC